jgi:mannose-6-phosphate isomerase-like protein (cupin superfamily)
VLYLLKGHARLLGPEGVAPVKIDEGAAVFIPAAFPHVIENMGRQTTAVFLQAFTPPGPERVYRDPKDPRGRAAFEVIRDPAQASLPPGAALTVVDGNTIALIPFPGSASVSQRNLLGAKTPGTNGPEVTQLELSDGAELSTKGSAKVEELYFVQAGAGHLKVAGESLSVEQDSLICIPVSTSFSFRATASEKGQKVVLLKFSNPVK